MPHCCSVPNCNGNYRNGPKVAVFSFPTEPERLHKWIRAIKRDFKPTTYSKVCELHFTSSDILREVSAYDEKTGKTITAPLKIPKLRENAVPSKMPNCPAYMSSEVVVREAPDVRNTRKEEASLTRALTESLKSKQDYDAERQFHDFEELKLRLHLISLPQCWSVVTNSNSVMFCKIAMSPIPTINCSVVVSDHLDVRVYVANTLIKKLGNKFTFPMLVDNVNIINNIIVEANQFHDGCNENSVCDILHLIENMLHAVKSSAENKSTLMGFLEEQISLLQIKKPNYSCEMIVFATLFYTISPHAYRFVRSTENLQLPHPNTIQRVCLSCNFSPVEEQSDNNFLKYVRYKSSKLDVLDKKVNLMVDEVHVKPYLDYKCGNIAGMSFDGTKMASSAHVFMISSITSTYKDVVHILPVKSITHIELHSFIKRIIVGLEEIGFSVICVITDNNAINRKAMSLFSKPPCQQIVYPHPVIQSRPLFFIIDPVHLLKCIRNNWLNQRNPEKNMYFPNFTNFTQNEDKSFDTASLSSLRKLHNCEANSLAKFGYNLTLKALSPSNFEKQNVNLVLKIFNEFVAEALSQLGPKYDIPHFSGTAAFIKIIYTWWSIMNVKSPYKGIRLNDVYKYPLTYSESDIKLMFLNKFLDWLDMWKDMSCTTGMLTKETHSALRQTTYAITEIASYCKSELGLDYILPGKYQTDQLESRFSLYRQLAGGQYHVSMRQIFESEKKLRMQSSMKLFLKTKSHGTCTINISNFSLDSTFDVFVADDNTECFSINVMEADIESVTDQLPVIKYIGGYIVYSVLKKLQCDDCKTILALDKDSNDDETLDFTKKLDRGQLVYPTQKVVDIVMYTFVVITKLCTEHEEMFLKVRNQRTVAASITLDIVINEEMCIEDICSNGHTPAKIVNMIIWSAVNIFLNNYCKERNNTENVSGQKKRKLQVFAS